VSVPQAGSVGILTIVVWIVKESDGMGGYLCRWKAQASWGGAVVVRDPSDPDLSVYCFFSACYQSSTFSDEDCQTFPVTLTKTGEYISSGFCAGEFPDTLTLDSAI
jgi:hypothetical protein